jgi:tetratricopeptide (TPR) repeat protein
LIEEVKPQFATLDDRNAATALSIAGNIYMLSERYDLAKAAYEQLLSKRADDVGALNNLACVVAEHAEPPNVDLALKYSQRAIDAMAKRGAAQQDAAVLDTYGWMNVLAGGANVDRGVEYLNNSLKAGEIPEAHYHLGEAFLRKQWPEQAKSSLARASTMIDERLAKQPEDASLKQLRLKVEQSSAKVEKALLEPRAGAR